MEKKIKLLETKIKDLEQKIKKADELNQQQFDLIMFLQRQIKAYESTGRINRVL